MTFSIHTFELSMKADGDMFRGLLKTAYGKAKKKHRLFEKNGVSYDGALSKHGIKVEYHDGRYKKRVKVIVNPSRVLGGDDLQLWKPDKQNRDEMVKLLKERLAGYFDGEYGVEDFKLTRVDFTVNLDVGGRKNVSAYIKILHNLGKVKGFSPKYAKNAEGIDHALSFDLTGNSNGVEFSAYDKEGELVERDKSKSRVKDAKGILRVEVRLMKNKAIRIYADEPTTAKQIKKLAKDSEKIFMETFARIVPQGDYYKKKEAAEIITASACKNKTKEKMLRLLELVPKKKSLLLAQKEMDDRNIVKVMKAFADIGVSPVTISKRADVKRMDSLYSYLI